MIRLALIFGNLLRARMRSCLLLLSVFIAFMLFGVLTAFERAYSSGGDIDRGRMIAVNKISFTQPLPQSFFQRVQAVEGISAVTHATWFGAYYQQPRNSLHAMAIEPESFLHVYREDILLSEQQRQAFLQQRSGILIGKTLAEKWSWKEGDIIPVMSNRIAKMDGSFAWEFTVSAIFTAANAQIDTNFMYLHFDYLNEARREGKYSIGALIFEPEAGIAGDVLGQRVDRFFASEVVSTTTDTEKSFNRSFIAQFGDLAQVILLVTAAAFSSLLLILGNTLMLAVRERTREIGVLKALGFSGYQILGFILTETLIIAVVGGSSGLAMAAYLVKMGRQSLGQIAPGMAVNAEIWGIGVLLMFAVTLIAGLIPAVSAMKLNTAVALGRH